MDNTIKSLTITGSAAEDAMKPRRSTSRKKQQDEGGEDEMPASEFSRVIPRILPRPPVQQQTKPQQPVPQSVQQPLHQPLQVQEAGSVILRPPKVQRVKLQPKIQMKSITQPHAPVAHTRKARKIHMTVANLNHRFTRAKKVHAESGAKSMDAIRDFLVGKGVIQMKSKAPEKMLRSMYSDFMLLKDQAL